MLYAVDDTDYGAAPKMVINRAVLPTAPRASRGANVDMSLVPNEPPFTAYIGNLPFEANVEDVEHFFKGLKVCARDVISEFYCSSMTDKPKLVLWEKYLFSCTKLWQYFLHAG